MLITSNTKIFFAAESGAYRYWLTPQSGERHTVLKIQVKRKIMDAFRASNVGRTLFSLVDIFESGGGWFEIVGRDLTKRALSEFVRQFAAALDGVKVWLREFNKYQLASVNANDQFNPLVVVDSDHRAIALAAKAQAKDRLVSKVHTLAAKFGKSLSIA